MMLLALTTLACLALALGGAAVVWLAIPDCSGDRARIRAALRAAQRSDIGHDLDRERR